MGYFKNLLLEAEELDIDLGYNYDAKVLEKLEDRVNDE